MARTPIPTVQITLDGISPSVTDGTAGDVTNGNDVAGNDGRTLFVAVANTGASPYTVTFVTPGAVGAEQYAIADKVESLAAGAKAWFGPFPTAEFTNQLLVDVENVGVKLKPFRI